MPPSSEGKSNLGKGDSPAAETGQGRALPWALRLLIVAAILLPLAGTAMLAAKEWRSLQQDAAVELERAGALAQEHAQKVFETANLVLERMLDRLQGRSWREIAAEAPALVGWLRSLDERLDHLRAVHIIDPEGRLVVSSAVWPTPEVEVRSREYFRVHAAGFTGTFLGEPVIGRTTGLLAFTVSRPRLTPDGRFDGVVMGSVPPGYFDLHWAAMAGPQGYFALFRPDGQILAQWSADGLAAGRVPMLPANGEGARRTILTDRTGGQWLATIRRVWGGDLLVAYATPRSALVAAWREYVVTTGVIALSMMMAMMAVIMLAWRRWASEQRALSELTASHAAVREQISRREAAEERLAQAQRLEAMGRLTGGIAHDFNNLLTAILGTVNLLDRHLGPQADDRTRRLIGAARDAVGRGARLNASLLAFARRQPLKREPLDVHALLRGFEPLLRRAMGDAVTLRLDLAAERTVCEADAAQLEAALLNLALNARDAMPRGGEVTIATRNTWLSEAELHDNEDARPGSFAEIRVTDTGTGMPAEVRDRAFEPFFTTKPQGKGTGLGLSQVFGFMRQLGGHVAISSAPGQGTTVSLFLPLSGAATAPHPADTGGRAVVVAVASATVLIAEDDPEVREVAAELLRDAGYRVLAAADGREALNLLERGEAVDVLFTDVVMPGSLSGLELARAARRLRPGIGVLLASGYAMQALGHEALEFELLPKPYSREVLLRLIASMVPKPAQGAA